MLFNSYVFVLAFFPIVIFLYFLLNHFKKYNFAKVFLIGTSLFFYGYYNPWYLLIIVGSVIFNFSFSLLLQIDNKKLKKLFLIIALIANIGCLVYFKYTDFFIENINALFKTDIALLNIALPLGISFFTFQQLSFVIDCYKGDIKKFSFLDYALFVTYFPQLIAGPIVTHDEMIPQFADIEKKKFNSSNFATGLFCFVLGLSKKVIIADTFGALVDTAFADLSSLGTLNAALVMFSYTMQIYFDFSGYCDMATGIGRMMNLDIAQNFNSPYKAIGIVDFWKRWHITLTRFFTKYIYIPLGGNRKGKVRTYVNIMIVFIVSGIWHGANWTFIIWGILHGIGNCITRFIDNKTGLFSKNQSKIIKVILWALTFLFINLTWVIFRAESLTQALDFYKQLFSFNFVSIDSDLIQCLQTDGLSFFGYFIPVIGDYIINYAPYVFMIFSLFAVIFMKNTNERIINCKFRWFTPIIISVLFVWCIMSFAGVSSFLYWNF